MSLQITVQRVNNELSSDDEDFLKKMGERRLSLDQCISEAGAESRDILDSIRRLIRTGYLCLVISVYSWGNEFEIMQTKQDRFMRDREELE